MVARGYKGVKLYSLGDFGLVREKLDLLEPHYVGKLEDDLLWVGAKFGTLPTFALGRVIQQLSYRVIRVLTLNIELMKCILLT